MKQDLIKVVVVEPLTNPYVKTIKNELEGLQEVVGGYIQSIPLEGFDLVCNEEGKLDGLLMNRHLGFDIIAGTFFLTMADDEGNFRSLTDDEIDRATKLFDTTNKKYPALIGKF